VWDAAAGGRTDWVLAERAPVFAAAATGTGFVIASKGLTAAVTLSTKSVPADRHRTKTVAGRQPTSLVFDPDGKHAAANVGGNVVVWELPEGRVVHEFRCPTITRPVFSSCGRYLCAGRKVIDTKTWIVIAEVPLPISHNSEYDSSVQPNGPLVAIGCSGTKGGAVLIYDFVAKKLVHTIPTTDWPVGVAFSPDGQRLAVGLGIAGPNRKSPLLRVIDTTTGKDVVQVDDIRYGVWSVAWSPDGRWVATGGGPDLPANSGSGQVQVWDAATGRLVYDLKGHTNTVWHIAFSSDGRRLSSAAGTRPTGGSDRKGEFIIWDMKTGQSLLTRQSTGAAATAVAFSANGHWYGTAETGVIRFWDVRPHRVNAVLPTVRENKSGVER
jgi:WD40 repeat protein